MILDCECISKRTQEFVLNLIKQHNITPVLAVVQVGDNYSFNSYIANKTRKCEEIGIILRLVKLSEGINQEILQQNIAKLSSNKSVNGIVILNPLPKHLSIVKAAQFISSEKDIDGLRGIGLYKPCTAEAVRSILEFYKIDVTGKECLVVGRSIVSGKPIADMLENKNATVVKCNSYTKNVIQYTKKADVIVTSIGSPEYLLPSMVKKDAIIIDVGICKDKNSKLLGDANTLELSKLGCKITPVPKGVGLITTAILLYNTVNACLKQKEDRKMNDPVNHPSHYTRGKIEVADFIKDQRLNFDLGSAIKYICRAGYKDTNKYTQDLNKAIWFLNHEITNYSGQEANKDENTI